MEVVNHAQINRKSAAINARPLTGSDNQGTHQQPNSPKLAKEHVNGVRQSFLSLLLPSIRHPAALT
jgi:hypothetical protein